MYFFRGVFSFTDQTDCRQTSHSSSNLHPPLSCLPFFHLHVLNPPVRRINLTGKPNPIWNSFKISTVMISSDHKMEQHHNPRDRHHAELSRSHALTLSLSLLRPILPKCSSSFLSVSHSSLHPPSSSRAPSLQHCCNRKVRVGGSVLQVEYVSFMSLCSLAVNCCMCVDWIMIGLQRWAPSFPTALCLFVQRCYSAQCERAYGLYGCFSRKWMGVNGVEVWMDFKRFFTRTTFVYPHHLSFLCQCSLHLVEWHIFERNLAFKRFKMNSVVII